MSIETTFWDTLPTIANTDLSNRFSPNEASSPLSASIALASTQIQLPSAPEKPLQPLSAEDLSKVFPYQRLTWPRALQEFTLKMHNRDERTREIALVVEEALKPLRLNVAKLCKAISKWRYHCRMHSTNKNLKLCKGKRSKDAIASVVQNALNLPTEPSLAQIRYNLRSLKKG